MDASKKGRVTDYTPADNKIVIKRGNRMAKQLAEKKEKEQFFAKGGKLEELKENYVFPF